MAASPQDSVVFAPLLSEPRAAELLSDAAMVAAMLEAEAALARALGKAGVIPKTAAKAIDAAAKSVRPNFRELGKSAARNGPPIAALVAALRRETTKQGGGKGGRAAEYVHFGATSQDIMDTALILQIRRILPGMARDLDDAARKLAALARKHAETPMCARTRTQQATTTTFGLKCALWRAPLIRHRTRLAELRPRLLCAQLGGAAGTLSAFADKKGGVGGSGVGVGGVGVGRLFARELKLGAPILPWHSQRDCVGEFANWLALVSGSLGKLGADLALLAQTEVGEVHFRGAGVSTAMPQKANPILAETLISLARHAGGLASDFSASAIHAQERDGAAWQLEWLTLPQLIITTAAALRTTKEALAAMRPNRARMLANWKAGGGMILAEDATTALAARILPGRARALVSAACVRAAKNGRSLADELTAADPDGEWGKFFADDKARTKAAAEMARRGVNAGK